MLSKQQKDMLKALSLDLIRINVQYTQEKKNPEQHCEEVLLMLSSIRKLLNKAEYDIFHGVLDVTKRFDEYLQDFGEKLTEHARLIKLISVIDRLINWFNETQLLGGKMIAINGSFF